MRPFLPTIMKPSRPGPRRAGGPGKTGRRLSVLELLTPAYPIRAAPRVAPSWVALRHRRRIDDARGTGHRRARPAGRRARAPARARVRRRAAGAGPAPRGA